MKSTLVIFVIGISIVLSGCAYVEGIENQKKVIPIPKDETPPQPSPTVGPIPGETQATTQAAKAISPVR